MSPFPLSILLGTVGLIQILLLLVIPGLVGLSTAGFVKYSKTKKTGWIVLGTTSTTLLLIIIIAAILIVNEKPWLNR